MKDAVEHMVGDTKSAIDTLQTRYAVVREKLYSTINYYKTPEDLRKVKAHIDVKLFSHGEELSIARLTHEQVVDIAYDLYQLPQKVSPKAIFDGYTKREVLINIGYISPESYKSTYLRGPANSPNFDAALKLYRDELMDLFLEKLSASKAVVTA